MKLIRDGEQDRSDGCEPERSARPPRFGSPHRILCGASQEHRENGELGDMSDFPHDENGVADSFR